MFKKVMSLVLVMSILCSSSIYSFAETAPSDTMNAGEFEIIERVHNTEGEIVKEVSEYKGISNYLGI